MVTNITMHDYYSQEIKEELNLINESILSIEESLERLKPYFNTWDLAKTFNYKYSELIKGQVAVTNNSTTSKEKEFNIKLGIYNNLYKVLEQKKGRKKELELINIPCNLFCFILLEFNKRLIKKMIFNQYKFSNLYIGDLLVVPYKYKETKLAVNWPVSKKNKADIIARGDVPYMQAEERKAKKEGKDYNGVKWLEFFPALTLLFGWDKSFKNFSRLAESRNFIFRASRGQKKNAPIKQLKLFKDSLTEEDYITLYNFNAK